MRIVAICLCTAMLLGGCGGLPAHLTPASPPSAVPTRTPSIQTPTAIILSPVPITATMGTHTETPTPTFVEVTPTGTATLSPTAPAGSVSASILGCDTSIDLTHGMGEVTNAYVTVSNTTEQNLPDTCATLRALDEGRPHPDKTKCLPVLSAGYQVTFKLTVDSTYKASTPVQVELTSGSNLIFRTGEAACTAIGVLLPEAEHLGTPEPIP